MLFRLSLLTVIGLIFAGCDPLVDAPSGQFTGGETGRVTRVIDGDTIDVNINGTVERIRYVGVNTPERDEPCYSEASAANASMVEGQTVRLERDQTNRDRFDRLLRYVYVGDTLVNRELIVQGYGEAVLYQPDNRHFTEFSNLERQSANASRGCHPTGIFDDGTDTR